MNNNEVFVKRSGMPASASALFAWHERPGAFERLQPPWEAVEVVRREGSIKDGNEVQIRTKIGPLYQTWVVRHQNYVAGQQFQDVQIKGPFRFWRHTHKIEPDGQSASVLEDHIEYALPLGVLGRIFGGPFVQNKLRQMFHYRHHVTAADLTLSADHHGVQPMRVLVSGSSGLIGSALVPLLTTNGHDVVRLVRHKALGPETIAWHSNRGLVNINADTPIDAVIHLAGENIAGKRWSSAQKELIRSSRVDGTRLLCESLSKLKEPPKTLLCASAIGYYGDQGEKELTEESPAGDDFLAAICNDWEQATQLAKDHGIRVVNLRFGIVLSPAGGALKKMLTPFRLGAGGRLGSGKQYMSWIAIDDVIGAIYHCLMNEHLSGPVNVVAPQPLTNAKFTKILGKVLRRPAVMPAPALGLRMTLGEMADALLLASNRVMPTKLIDSGYTFRFSDLESALRHLLGRIQT